MLGRGALALALGPADGGRGACRFGAALLPPLSWGGVRGREGLLALGPADGGRGACRFGAALLPPLSWGGVRGREGLLASRSRPRCAALALAAAASAFAFTGLLTAVALKSARPESERFLIFLSLLAAIYQSPILKKTLITFRGVHKKNTAIPPHAIMTNNTFYCSEDHLPELVSQLYTIRSVIMLDLHRAGLEKSKSLGIVNAKIEQAKDALDARTFEMCIKTMHERCS